MILNKKSIVMGLVASMLIFSACGSSSSGSDNDGDDGSGITETTAPMSASSGDETNFNLATGLVDATTWHFAYQKYVGFRTNGGTSGDGGITACIAKKYDALFDNEGTAVASEFKSLTGENTLADFDAVLASDCEADAYQADGIKTQIQTPDWLDADYSTGAPVFSAKNDSNNSWIIRSSDGESYSRVKVKTVTVEFGATTSRKIVLSSELWDGSAWEAAQDSPELDFSSSKAYWDLELNQLKTQTDTDWDLAVSVVGQTYPIQVNGGASGDGSGGVGILQVTSTADVTDPTNTDQVYKYFADEATGAMDGPGSYGALSYGVDGGHAMWPTFAVYIVDDGTEKYKYQITSNTGADGTLSSGNLVVRYEKLD